MKWSVGREWNGEREAIWGKKIPGRRNSQAEGMMRGKLSGQRRFQAEGIANVRLQGKKELGVGENEYQ